MISNGDSDAESSVSDDCFGGSGTESEDDHVQGDAGNQLVRESWPPVTHRRLCPRQFDFRCPMSILGFSLMHQGVRLGCFCAGCSSWHDVLALLGQKFAV